MSKDKSNSKDIPSEVNLASFSGNDIYWFINGISFVCAMYNATGLDITTWIEVGEDNLQLGPEFGEALITGMEKAARMPIKQKIDMVVQFMQSMGVDFHIHSMEQKFDA